MILSVHNVVSITLRRRDFTDINGNFSVLDVVTVDKKGNEIKFQLFSDEQLAFVDVETDKL